MAAFRFCIVAIIMMMCLQQWGGALLRTATLTAPAAATSRSSASIASALLRPSCSSTTTSLRCLSTFVQRSTVIVRPTKKTFLWGSNRDMSDYEDYGDANTKSPPISWYPGHIAKAERELSDYLKKVDVVIEVRDARIPISTTHPMVPTWVGNRPLIVAIARIDQISKKALAAWREYYAYNPAHPNRPDIKVYFIDGKLGAGVMTLKKQALKSGVDINERRKRRGIQPRAVRAAVIGFPNVGKLRDSLDSSVLTPRYRQLATGSSSVGRIVHSLPLSPRSVRLLNLADLRPSPPTALLLSSLLPPFMQSFCWLYSHKSTTTHTPTLTFHPTPHTLTPYTPPHPHTLHPHPHILHHTTHPTPHPTPSHHTPYTHTLHPTPHPPTGKSALINRLLGRKMAKSRNLPGVTKSLMWVRMGGREVEGLTENTIELLDSPGIIPARQLDHEGE